MRRNKRNKYFRPHFTYFFIKTNSGITAPNSHQPRNYPY